MASKWRTETRNGTTNGISSRELHQVCDQLEARVNELEKFSDELRLGQTLREEQIRSMRDDIGLIHKQIGAQELQTQTDKAALTLEIASIRDKIDTFKVEFGDRINLLRTDTTLALTNARNELTAELDKGLRSLNDKFDDNKNYFTRYFIIILVTILTGLVVGGAAIIIHP